MENKEKCSRYITNLLARVEAAERERDNLREAMKLNCLMCDSMHPDNGNCTEVGGFCTAVPAAHCPLIPRLMEENDRMKNVLKATETREEKYKAFFDDVAGKPNCNTCADQECSYRPKPGEITRFNCPLWRGQKEE